MKRTVRITDQGILVPRDVLEAAGLAGNAELIAFDGGVLVLDPASPGGRAVAASLESFDRFDGTYRKLAE